MNLLKSLLGTVARAFGYDAVEQGTKRRIAANNVRSEDSELNGTKRRQLLAQTNDLLRNFAVARWAVGKHLDFVSRFSFVSQTKTDWDYEFQSRMDEWANDKNLCDIRGQHTLARLIRMTEGRAVTVGDHLLIKTKGGKLQQVESDRIRDYQYGEDKVVHGVVQDKHGKAIAYQVHNRGANGSGYVFADTIKAEDALFHAYYPSERADQTRGVGLITAGINDFVDAYEWGDIAKATEKSRAALAMIFKTTSGDGTLGTYQPTGNGKYEVALGQGPFSLELDPTDTAEFLTSNTPSGNTVSFFNGCIGFALKSLDIPLCFYDETLTNFFGQRAQFILYIESCKSKRDSLRSNVLHPLTDWLKAVWIADGKLKLPAGATSTTLGRIPYQWRPAGLPWWNPVQEVTANLMAIRGGLANYEDVYLEATGRDWFEDMRRLKEQQNFLSREGIVLDPDLAPTMAGLLMQQQTQNDQQQNDQQQSNPLSALPTVGGLAI